MKEKHVDSWESSSFTVLLCSMPGLYFTCKEDLIFTVILTY